MPVTYLCKLIAFTQKGFKDKESGEQVSFNEAWFISESVEGERSVFSINTKTDLSKLLDKEVTLSVAVDPSGKRKPRMVSCVLAE